MRETHHSRDQSDILANSIYRALRDAVEEFNSKSPVTACLVKEDGRWAFLITAEGMELKPEFFGRNGRFSATDSQPGNPQWSVYRTLTLESTLDGALKGTVSDTQLLPVNQGGRR